MNNHNAVLQHANIVKLSWTFFLLLKIMYILKGEHAAQKIIKDDKTLIMIIFKIIIFYNYYI